MKLYNKERKIQASNDKSFHDLEIVIYQILKAVKERAIKVINSKRNIEIREYDIEWKLTVPAIWREKKVKK